MSEYNRAHFRLRATEERENALASPHPWQRERYLAMAEMFDSLAQQYARCDSPDPISNGDRFIREMRFRSVAGR